MNRFFEKSENIDEISDKEIDGFLRKEKIIGKVEPQRVKDFYHALSSISNGEDIKRNGIVDYDFFKCKKEEDIEKINDLREMEEGYLNNVQKSVLSDSRLLKAAVALSYQFEKMVAGKSEMRDEEITEYLEDLFNYHTDIPDDDNATFDKLLEMNFHFLRYIALLSKRKAFQKKSTKLERSPVGNVVKYTPMESFNEVFNMDLIQSVMPNFNIKTAQMDIYVKSRFNKIERGQNLVILVDDSGSMSNVIKKGMLGAALTLKINDISPAHNVYIGTFETRLYGFKKIEKGTTFEDLRSFIYLNKGTTDVNGCIMETISQIKARKLKGRDGEFLPLSEDSFEILVINDGDDHVDPSYHPAIKTHALCLMRHNNHLKNICHRSGGTYSYMTGNK